MPDGESFKWVQLGITLIAGGMAGAILNYIIAERKNRIQPIGMKQTVSYVDLPEILKGYGAQIALANAAQSKVLHFNNIAVIRIELVNSGNKDLEAFKLGVNLPEKAEAIGFQGEGDDRYHTVQNDRVVSTDSPQSELNIEMKPFHRKDRYTVTIIANTESRKIKDEIKFSKQIPVKFVDFETKDTFNYSRLASIFASFTAVLALTATVFTFFTFYKAQEAGKIQLDYIKSTATSIDSQVDSLKSRMIDLEK